jgi:hypothetical protein
MNNEKLNLERIAWTTLGYGVAGSFFSPSLIIAPLMAGIGFVASAYDETKQKNLDLSLPAVGAVVGGLIGSLFAMDSNHYILHILSYTGGVAGGLLGSYKSYLGRRKN